MVHKRKKERVLSSKAGFLPVILLLFVFAVQSLWHAKTKSATYDESGHLAVSTLLVRTTYQEYDIGHPPLIRFLFSIPSLLLKASLPPQIPLPTQTPNTPLSQHPSSQFYYYATHFLYGNVVPAERLLFWTRCVNIFLGCLLALGVFVWSSKLYGRNAGLFSLFLCSFSPNLIAHSSLVTTDVGGVVFAFGFLWMFSRMIQKDTLVRAGLAGIFLGLALLSKYTNVILVPIFFIFYFVFKNKEMSWKEFMQRILLAAFMAWLILCAGYQFREVFVFHTLQPEDWKALGWGSLIQRFYKFVPLPDTFLKGFAYADWHNQRGHGSFLLGRYASLGWWYYFPVAFLLKTPSVVLGILVLYGLRFKKRWSELLRDEVIIVGLAALFLGTVFFARINIGIRHLLLVYPLLFVLLGREIKDGILLKKRMWQFGFLALLPLEVLFFSPHYLAFFNGFSGGPNRGIYYLSDSNIDWGQDLKNLSQFLKQNGNPEIVLSYFGTAVPEFYGIQYERLPVVWSYPKSNHLNSVTSAKEFLAVSVTHLQGTYFIQHDLYQWLLNKEPIAKIGYSIYVYDITKDVESQKRLSEIYQLMGWQEHYQNRIKRLNFLEGEFGG